MKNTYHKSFTGMLKAPDGTCRWFVKGVLGREGDQPAVEGADGTKIWYIENPKRGKVGQRDAVEHRDNAPALVRSNGDCFWYQYGKLHRNDGPAVELVSGARKWFLMGLFVRMEWPESHSVAEEIEVPSRVEIASALVASDKFRP